MLMWKAPAMVTSPRSLPPAPVKRCAQASGALLCVHSDSTPGSQVRRRPDVQHLETVSPPGGLGPHVGVV